MVEQPDVWLSFGWCSNELRCLKAMYANLVPQVSEADRSLCFVAHLLLPHAIERQIPNPTPATSSEYPSSGAVQLCQPTRLPTVRTLHDHSAKFVVVGPQ
jgi:hypothetical protein